MAKQKIDKFYIYKTNFWSTLTFPKPPYNSGDGAAAVIGGWFITLPLSLTPGVGIKTLIDINTRHGILESQIENIKTTIQHLDGKIFDTFIQNILKYNTRSNSNKALSDKLISAETNEKDKINMLSIDEKQRIKNEKVKHFIEKKMVMKNLACLILKLILLIHSQKQKIK